MSILDIIILVVIGLCALLGLVKGTFKSLISFFGWALSFIAAFFLTRIIAEALLDVEVLRNFVIGTEGFSLYGFVTDAIPEAVLSSGIMQTIFSPFIGTVNSAIAAGTMGTATAAQGMALMVSYGIFSAIVCLALFVVIRILMMLFTMFLKSFSRGNKPGALSRLFGFVIGGAKGFCYTVFAFVILCYLTIFPFAAVAVEQIDQSIIGKPIFEQVSLYTDKLIGGNHDEAFQKLLSYAGFKDEADAVDEDDGGNQNNIHETNTYENTAPGELQNFAGSPEDSAESGDYEYIT